MGITILLYMVGNVVNINPLPADYWLIYSVKNQWSFPLPHCMIPCKYTNSPPDSTHLRPANLFRLRQNSVHANRFFFKKFIKSLLLKTRLESKKANFIFVYGLRRIVVNCVPPNVEEVCRHNELSHVESVIWTPYCELYYILCGSGSHSEA